MSVVGSALLLLTVVLLVLTGLAAFSWWFLKNFDQDALNAKVPVQSPSQNEGHSSGQ